MNELLPDRMQLTCAQLSSYFEVKPQTVQCWARQGYLKGVCKRTAEHRKHDTWIFKGTDVADFLYFNPQYREKLEQHDALGDTRIIRNAILKDIYQRPFKTYTYEGLSAALITSKRSIRGWEHNHGMHNLKSISPKQTIPFRIFRAVDVMEFMEQNSRIKKSYSRLLGEKFVDWDLDFLN